MVLLRVFMTPQSSTTTLMKNWETLNGYIDHDRDLKFTYAGLRQVYDKYLVQDRSSGKIYETPQFMYMLIAATIFHAYPKDVRLGYVKRYYDAVSRTLLTSLRLLWQVFVRLFVSMLVAFLLRLTTPSTPSSSSDMAIGYYTSQRAGIGINAGRIRALGDKIRGGEVAHTGVILPEEVRSQPFVAAPRTVFVVVLLPFTSPSGIKRLKTSSFSRTTRVPKTTVFVNWTTLSRSPNCSTVALLPTKKSLCSPPTMFLVSMTLSVNLSSMHV